MGVRVVTDSACDLPHDLIERHGIEVVPLTIRFGNEELVDRKELSTDEFWRRLAELGCPARDVGAVGGSVRGAFREPDRRRRDRHHLHQPLVARSRRRCSRRRSRPQAVPGRLPGRRSIDSLSVSMGLGSLCLTAARRAADGDSLESIVAERHRPARSLQALRRRSTRSSSSRRAAGSATPGRSSASMLAIKPVLEVRDGVVEEAGKVRTRSKALRARWPTA